MVDYLKLVKLAYILKLHKIKPILLILDLRILLKK